MEEEIDGLLWIFPFPAETCAPFFTMLLPWPADGLSWSHSLLVLILLAYDLNFESAFAPEAERCSVGPDRDAININTYYCCVRRTLDCLPLVRPLLEPFLVRLSF